MTTGQAEGDMQTEYAEDLSWNQDSRGVLFDSCNGLWTVNLIGFRNHEASLRYACEGLFRLC